MAHPLRVRLCDQLATYGPATATQLASRLGESSGATSYHLRQLEKFGFVEEDPGRGTGRERWWRLVPGGVSLDEHTFTESPATHDAAMLVVNEFGRFKQARIEKWRATSSRWPLEWSDASVESTSHIRLTAAELAEVGAQLDAVVTEWVERTRGRQGADAADVEVQWYAFPVGDPPAPDGGQ